MKISAFKNTNIKKEIEFISNGELTLGVEIELQIIDKNSLNLTSRADEILAQDVENIKQELYLNMIEINSCKCSNVQDAEKDLSQSLDTITKIADSLDLKLATTACHPFSRYSDSILTPSPRYNELIDRNQWLTRRMTVFGLHVHLGMKNGDDAIRFNNFFLNLIPHLIALSASSPFWQGDDTGLDSCRPTTYESLPTAGHPYRVKNWSEFRNLYKTLRICGAIESIKDLWWDIRPSPNYGTLEIRACDGPATLDETLAIVAFIHLLAHWFYDNASWLNQVPASPLWFSRENKWRAIRHGLEANLITNLNGETRKITHDIEQWLERLEPYQQKFGYNRYIETLRQILTKGNSSSRQRAIYAKTNSLQEVVKFNIAEFNNRSPIW